MMQNDSPKRNDAKPSNPKRRRRRRGGSSSSQKPSPGQEVLSKSSTLDTSSQKDADHHAPMSADEMAEMKEHLLFLFRNRKRFNLKINAKEDLLLNGSREPTERGVCLHLLRKVDRACVEKTLERISDPKLKVQLLQGVVRFSSDVGILIFFLESLRESTSKKEAASALSLGLKRIDFDSATKAQMSRVLDLILSLFPKNELPQLLFGLLQSESFRKAFDHSSDRLPSVLHELFVPIRTVYSAVIEEKLSEDAKHLKRGLALVFASDAETIAKYPEQVRERFFEYALQLTDKPSETDPVLRILLDSFPKKSRSYSTLGILWVEQLLERHADEKAIKLLNQIKTHHPKFAQPSRWLDALSAKRVGRIAILPSQNPANMQFGFWLDHQRSVLIRLGEQEQGETFEKEAQIHEHLLAPGIAPFVNSGKSTDGIPYIAIALVGHPALEFYKKRPSHLVQLQHCQEGIQLLWVLSQTKISLPSFGISRCTVDSKQRLWLVDLSGASQTSSQDAFVSNFQLAKAWVQSQLHHLPKHKKPLFLESCIEEKSNFRELMSVMLELKR